MSHYDLKQFIHLIKALDFVGFNHLYTNSPEDGQRKIQLSYDLNIQLVRLQRSLFDSNWGFLDPNYQFNVFFKQLVREAINNDLPGANAHTAQAQKLLAFFLHHDLQLVLNGETVSLRDLALTYMPKNHRLEYENSLRSNLGLSKYPYLRAAWRTQQQFPSLTGLNQVLERHARSQDKQQNPMQKDQRFYSTFEEQEQQEEKERQEVVQRVKAYRDLHFFDNVVFGLAEFADVLESFLSFGRLAPFAMQSQDNKPVFSPAVTQNIEQFVNLARSEQNHLTQLALPNAFLEMMKSLIASSKAESQYQLAAAKLVGFLMCHDFQFEHQNQRFKYSDIFKGEMSSKDWTKLAQDGVACMPFVTKEWQDKEIYPGKRDLEIQFEGLYFMRQRFGIDNDKKYDPMDIEVPAMHHQKRDFRKYPR